MIIHLGDYVYSLFDKYVPTLILILRLLKNSKSFDFITSGHRKHSIVFQFSNIQCHKKCFPIDFPRLLCLNIFHGITLYRGVNFTNLSNLFKPRRCDQDDRYDPEQIGTITFDSSTITKL